jgi:hypothetical protein
MANERDEEFEPGFDDDRMEEGPDHSQIVAKAKARTSTPGTLMVAAACFMILWSLFGFWLNFASGIDVNLKMLEYMRDNFSQDQKFKDEMQKQIDQRLAADKTPELVMNGFFGALGMVGNILVLLAGLWMRQLKSYAICMTGSIFAIIMNGCCCIGLPLGIWSLVVLANRDVKRGFEIARTRA